MRRSTSCVASIMFFGLAALTYQPAHSAEEPTTIYRDEFGIPHIFASTLDDAAFAAGYAQAEDRLEELLKNYRRATGTMAEVFGPDSFREDIRCAASCGMPRSAAPVVQRHQPENARRARILSKRNQTVRHGRSIPSRSHPGVQKFEPADAVALGRQATSGTGRSVKQPAT